jgi:hypothetical protein
MSKKQKPQENQEPDFSALKWQDLNLNVLAAAELVGSCASTSPMRVVLMCVHFTPHWVEASDKFQIARYRMETGFDKPFLVPADAVKEMNRVVRKRRGPQWAVSDHWIFLQHQWCSHGALHCWRKHEYNFPERDAYKYPKLDEFLTFPGKSIAMPRALQVPKQLRATLAKRSNKFVRNAKALRVEAGRLVYVQIAGWSPSLNCYRYRY